jgi:hypothetical protein
MYTCLLRATERNARHPTAVYHLSTVRTAPVGGTSPRLNSCFALGNIQGICSYRIFDFVLATIPGPTRWLQGQGFSVAFLSHDRPDRRHFYAIPQAKRKVSSCMPLLLFMQCEPIQSAVSSSKSSAIGARTHFRTPLKRLTERLASRVDRHSY